MRREGPTRALSTRRGMSLNPPVQLEKVRNCPTPYPRPPGMRPRAEKEAKMFEIIPLAKIYDLLDFIHSRG